MADKPDLDELAKKYLDLWQDQLAGLADDEEIAKTMARTIELMNASGAAFASMAQSVIEDETLKQGLAQGLKVAEQFGEALKNNDNTTAKTRSANTGPASGTTSAGDPSGVANPDINELTSRIAELEKRIATLEGTPKKSRRRTSRKTSKN